MHVLAIDPGNTESGYAFVDSVDCRPLDFGKVPNDELRDKITEGAFGHVDFVSIEMIASYGMAVGKEVFETCVWIGRFLELFLDQFIDVDLVYRKEVKLHLCQSTKAKDANITQALVDRFASGASNHGKGTKAAPGWFFGFRADVWQAYALAVLTADGPAARDERQAALEAAMRSGTEHAPPDPWDDPPPWDVPPAPVSEVRWTFGAESIAWPPPANIRTSVCEVCQTNIFWQDCPTGGWWIHHQHPKDSHDARPTSAPALEVQS